MGCQFVRWYVGKMKLCNRKKVIFVGVLFQTGGLMVISVILLLLIATINHAKASTAWPHADGVVTVGINSSQAGTDANVGNIWYEYEVGGKTFRCNRVSYFEENQLYKHPEGELVKVFYNPKDCQDACLVTGVSAMAMFRLWFYGFSFIWGVVMVFRMLYRIFYTKFAKNAKTSTAEGMAVASIGSVLAGF